MKFLLTVCVFLLTVSSSLSVDITVTGTEGRGVNITCPYPEGYKEYHKYFFKGPLKKRVLMLQSDGVKTRGRFSLKDNRQSRSFTVTISDLRMEDAGPYGCRTGAEHYKPVQLNVIRAPEKTTSVQISTSTIHPFTHTSTVTPRTETETRTTTGTRTGNTTDELYQRNTNLAPVTVGLGLALLVLALCSGTFFILKKRKRKSGTALFQQNVQHNTETDLMYEEIPNTNAATVTSSANQMPASHLNTRPKVSTVYATVTNQQPDSNPSHTHNQATDTDCDYYANTKPPEATQDSGTELIYTTVTHPQNIPTDEGRTYSAIKKKTVHR
ncbi:CMRF35-like molecule 5 [Pseudorasbora parva]|uniref:CMRF35-like molecule 5 n=1 Tax=Pseudorasbora parva TaxID=51549 RepID=UPI00351DEF33